jgi:predicted transcriptional regulator
MGNVRINVTLRCVRLAAEKQQVLHILSVSATSVTQHAKNMRRIILSSAACLALPYFSSLSHKNHDFREKITEHRVCVFISSTTSVWNVSHSKKNSARCHNCTQVSREVPIIVRLWGNLNFLNRFSKNTQISNLIKIRPLGAELFHADGRT